MHAHLTMLMCDHCAYTIISHHLGEEPATIQTFQIALTSHTTTILATHRHTEQAVTVNGIPASIPDEAVLNWLRQQPTQELGLMAK
ncbi:MAG: hypothetical protein J2P36_27475 [Ktedonobacteraceae bacterium]|nr:hypothetical protein [Ktedonobacteraceae bacterium]